MLNNKTAKELMENTSNFTILDYQLKTLRRGPFAGSPLGLFLIEEPGNPKSAVCAHVHFAKDDTSRVGRINLAHHLTPPRNEMLYVEGLHGLSKSEVRKRKHMIEYVAVPNVSQPCDREPDDLEYSEWKKEARLRCILFTCCIADQSPLKEKVKKGTELVKKCHDFVERNERGRWNGLTKRNMTSSDLSYSGKFRQKERS